MHIENLKPDTNRFPVVQPKMNCHAFCLIAYKRSCKMENIFFLFLSVGRIESNTLNSIIGQTVVVIFISCFYTTFNLFNSKMGAVHTNEIH